MLRFYFSIQNDDSSKKFTITRKTNTYSLGYSIEKLKGIEKPIETHWNILKCIEIHTFNTAQYLFISEWTLEIVPINFIAHIIQMMIKAREKCRKMETFKQF